MNEKYKPGEYAYLEFRLMKRPKYGNVTDYIISGVYKIIDSDKYNILVQEEEIELLIQKSMITKFEAVN